MNVVQKIRLNDDNRADFARLGSDMSSKIGQINPEFLHL